MLIYLLFYSTILFNSNNADKAAQWGWWRRRCGRQRYDEADGEDDEEAGDDGKDEAGDDGDDEEEAGDDGEEEEEAGNDGADEEEADINGNEEEAQTDEKAPTEAEGIVACISRPSHSHSSHHRSFSFFRFRF